jgi:rod shape-determining protein MreC
MKWCREHLRLTILGIVLIALLSLTVASFLNPGNSSWAGGQIQRLASYLQEPVSEAGSGFSATVKGLFQWRTFLEENEALKAENKELREELIRQTLSGEDLAELLRLSDALNYIDPRDRYGHVSGSVIAKDGSRWFQTFTINIGSLEGVHSDAVVINGDGLIGRVFDLGPDWAKVISVIDEKNNISFKVFRDPGIIGVLSGDGTGGLSGYLLQEDVSVVEGDVLITSGMEIYPQGIPIGKITGVAWNENSLLRTVTVEPYANFSNLQKVTVVIKEPVGTE